MPLPALRSLDTARLLPIKHLLNHRPHLPRNAFLTEHAPGGQIIEVALDMAGVAFEVLLHTGVLIEALPLWQDELDHPERFNNRALIENIRRDGVRLSGISGRIGLIAKQVLPYQVWLPGSPLNGPTSSGVIHPP